MKPKKLLKFSEEADLSEGSSSAALRQSSERVLRSLGTSSVNSLTYLSKYFSASPKTLSCSVFQPSGSGMSDRKECSFFTEKIMSSFLPSFLKSVFFFSSE